MSTLNKKLEYGDYQTPLDFCEKIVDLVSKEISPDVIFEPTFGLGHFLDASIMKFKNIKKIIGNEINSEYYNNFMKNHNSSKIILFNENIFEFDHTKVANIVGNNDKLLILGNPPWVTNSKLMSQSLKNLPKKSNFKNFKGFDSMTGASNFDICEYIILDLLNNYKDKNTSLAMLCKTNVVTNIIKFIHKYNFKLKNIKMYLFDAKKIFNVDCEACLFLATIDKTGEDFVSVYNIENPNDLLYQFGWKNNTFLSKFKNLKYDIDGKFFTDWRQGIKHDCSKIMELSYLGNNHYTNKLHENFTLEDTYIYQLLKSSDLKANIITKNNKYVLVTQEYIRQDTSHIENDAPNTWNYLMKHKDSFDKRKSSIYKNCPPFSIFGIGDYSFCKYKIAISGFYKIPNFVLVDSEEKAIMLDDTCYFIGFTNKIYAYITMVLLNSDIVKNFLSSIAFLDKKRPYTKDILMRIDIKKLVNLIDYKSFLDLSKKYNDYIKVDEAIYKKYQSIF